MSDTEFLDDTDQNVSESHSKLLEAVSQLDKGQRIKRAERSEPTLQVSEFHLVKSGIADSDAIHVKDLAKALGSKGYHHEIIRNLQTARKKVNLLQKPLEKPAADRIRRIVGFQNTTQELKKWNAVITKNRTAESLNFPLNQTSLKLEPTKEFVKRFRIQSDLEKELAKLEPPTEKENIEENDKDFSLTMEEMIMKRRETARLRAQQSYREAKARRQKKIKSKKFHRVQRKEKIKMQLKEFEELKKTNPEAALEKLEQLDRTRAEERMSLRHKNTGKWAQSKLVQAKYDKSIRQELSQQLSIGRELSQKLQKLEDSDEENEENDAFSKPSATDAENPWVQNGKSESEIDSFIKSYRKYWDEQNSQLPKQSSEIENMGTSKREEKKVLIENPKAPVAVEENTEPQESETTNKLKDEHINNDTKPHNIENKKASKKPKKQDQAVENNLKRAAPDIDTKPNKKVLLQKTSKKKITATSSWNVEPVQENDAQDSSAKISNEEKINKIFDLMDDKVQEKINSKLKRITESNVSNKKARKKKDVREENVFDGLEMQSTRQRPVIDSALYETANDRNPEPEINPEIAKNIDFRDISATTKPKINAGNKPGMEIDPNKYINVKPTHLHTDLPNDVTGGDEVLDDSEDEAEKQNIISEAFADDDVVEEFRKEKEQEVENSKPKDIDLSLPGWGSWGGKNIKIPKRKKKRFIIKVPKDLPRKDENKGDVIIFEEDDAKIKQHQVNELPYPFTSVKDYEASLRMPIGRNFVPENAHKKLIEPVVKTTIGKVIEPMTEDVLVKKDKQKSFIDKRRRKMIKTKKIKKAIK